MNTVPDPVNSRWSDEVVHAGYTAGARHCPEWRQRMIDSWNSPGGLNYLAARARYGDSSLIPAGIGTPDELSKMYAQRLSASTIYWVSPDMCDLIESSMGSLDTNDVALDADIFPHMTGICFLAKTRYGVSINVETGQLDDPIPIDVISWTPIIRIGRENDLHPVLMIDSWAIMDHPRTPMFPICHGGSEWELGHPVDTGRLDQTEAMVASATDDRRFLLALHALMASPGITETETITPDRAAQRRMKRAGIPSGEVKVVYVRGSRRDHQPTGEHGNYSCRWAVSGHWRNQPYGPGRKLRRPIWIAPYIKGPADAPLDAREVVRAIT
jgi:hypothetical protein